MDTKVKTTEYSWEDIVNAAEPNRNRKRAIYKFSNGREFTDSKRVSTSGDRMLLSGEQVTIGGEIAFI